MGFLGVYQPFADFAGTGATVPLLGFGNTLWKGMQEAIEKMVFLEFSEAALLPVQRELVLPLFLDIWQV